MNIRKLFNVNELVEALGVAPVLSIENTQVIDPKAFLLLLYPRAGALKLRFSQRIATWHDVARVISEGEMP
jgi:hypothetical protein